MGGKQSLKISLIPGRRAVKDLLRGFFIRRLNRFTVICSLKGRAVRAYLPNPGRLWEILLPGRRLFLSRQKGAGKLPYVVVAAEVEGYPVLLHTQLANSYAEELIAEKLIPGLEEYSISQREFRTGASRIDFLLEGKEKKMALEVKTSTLSCGQLALFPDAVTARGRKHLEELAHLAKNKGWAAGILFIVWTPKARYFLPDFHTDWEFSAALLRSRHDLFIQALVPSLENDLSLKMEPARPLQIPWQLVALENKNRGAYLVILRTKSKFSLSVGRLGEMPFSSGYYVYVGSAQDHLEARLERHRRKRKRFFWHIDYLRAKTDWVAGLPLRSSEDIECDLTRGLTNFSRPISGFGCSDCQCSSHLFYFLQNPLQYPPFIHLLHRFRYQSLERKIIPFAP